MKSEWFSLLRMASYLATILAFLIVRVGQAESFEPVLSLCSLFSGVVSVFAAGRFARMMGIFFVGLGTWFVWRAGIGIMDYVLLYGDMIFMLALFALAPLLALPVKLGGYGESIRELLVNRIKSLQQMYRLVTSISFLLGTFLNVATLPLMYPITKLLAGSFKVTNEKRFVNISILHGYALPIMLTPVSGVVGVVVETTGVRWLELLPYLLFYCLAGLVLSWIMFSLRIPSLNPFELGAPELAMQEHKPEKDANAVHVRKLLHIITAILLLVVIVLITDHFLSAGLAGSVALAAFPFALVWALLVSRGRSFLRDTGNYFRVQLPKMSELFVVFVAAGFFLRALQYSGMDAVFNNGIVQWIEWVGTSGLLLSIPLLIIALSFIGVNPVITITLLAGSLRPDLFDVSLVGVAVACLGGAMITFLVGPYSGSLGLMSTLSGASTYRISGWCAAQAAALYALLGITVVMIG